MTEGDDKNRIALQRYEYVALLSSDEKWKSGLRAILEIKLENYREQLRNIHSIKTEIDERKALYYNNGFIDAMVSIIHEVDVLSFEKVEKLRKKTVTNKDEEG